MNRPVERFRIGMPPYVEDEAASRCRRLRPGEPETIGAGAIICWALSVTLAGYAAWQIAGLWLAP